jgi:hypothetical protein
MSLFAKADVIAASVAAAVCGGLFVFLATAALLVQGPAPGQPIGANLSALGTFWPGYTVMPGVHVVGGGGSFCYNNADHSIEMELLLGRRLLGFNVDPLAVNTEQEYHEEIRSVVVERDHYTLGQETTRREPKFGSCVTWIGHACDTQRARFGSR